MADDDQTPDLVIEYSIDGGAAWQHGKTVPAWVGDDPAMLSIQRAAVRDYARGEHGPVDRVITRVLAEDDPRCVLGQPATVADLLGEPVLEVTVAAGPETLMALFLAMQDDLAEEFARTGVIPVTVVHGYMETAEDAAAVEQLARVAEECGCRSTRGGSDYTSYLFTGDGAAVTALRFTSRADAMTRPGWKITPTFQPSYERTEEG